MVAGSRGRAAAYAMLFSAMLLPGSGRGAEPDPGDPASVAAGDVACDPADRRFNDGLGSARRCRTPSTCALLVDGSYTAAFGVFCHSCGWLDAEAPTAEVDEGDQRLGGVEAEAAVGDEADAAGESFEAAVGKAEPGRVEDAAPCSRRVRASLTNGVSFERAAALGQTSSSAGACGRLSGR